jgi:hypothetical protein
MCCGTGSGFKLFWLLYTLFLAAAIKPIAPVFTMPAVGSPVLVAHVDSVDNYIR